MKTTHTNAAFPRIVTACLALLIALSLSVPAHAKDIELEPDGFASVNPFLRCFPSDPASPSGITRTDPTLAAQHLVPICDHAPPAGEHIRSGVSMSSGARWNRGALAVI